MENELLQMALEAINEELKIDPQNALLYKERGRLRMMLHDERGAMDDLRQAFSLDPTLADSLMDGQFQGNIGGCHK